MFARRILPKSVITISKRNSGGWLKKNMSIEENSGLKENTYQTWEFTWRNSLEIVKFFVIPCVLIYYFSVRELEDRDLAMNIERKYGYGLLPPLDTYSDPIFNTRPERKEDSKLF